MYLFTIPFTSDNCCYSLILLDGAEGRRHFSKNCVMLFLFPQDWKTSDVHLIQCICWNCILQWFHALKRYPTWSRVTVLALVPHICINCIIPTGLKFEQQTSWVSDCYERTRYLAAWKSKSWKDNFRTKQTQTPILQDRKWLHYGLSYTPLTFVMFFFYTLAFFLL